MRQEVPKERPRKATVEGKAIPIEAWKGSKGPRRFSFPGYLDTRYMKVVRLSDPRTGRIYPPFLLISFRNWVNYRATVRLEGLCQWNAPMTSGIEPETLQLVAQCLNQLSHRWYGKRKAKLLNRTSTHSWIKSSAATICCSVLGPANQYGRYNWETFHNIWSSWYYRSGLVWKHKGSFSCWRAGDVSLI